MQLFIVTAGYDYEGNCGQWAFADEASARAKFDAYSAALRAEDEGASGDYVTLRGPFPLGENMCDYGSAKLIAHCNPAQEAAEAAYQARLAKAKEKRRAAKAARAAAAVAG